MAVEKYQMVTEERTWINHQLFTKCFSLVSPFSLSVSVFSYKTAALVLGHFVLFPHITNYCRQAMKNYPTLSSFSFFYIIKFFGWLESFIEKEVMKFSCFLYLVYIHTKPNQTSCCSWQVYFTPAMKFSKTNCTIFIFFFNSSGFKAKQLLLPRSSLGLHVNSRVKIGQILTSLWVTSQKVLKEIGDFLGNLPTSCFHYWTNNKIIKTGRRFLTVAYCICFFVSH